MTEIFTTKKLEKVINKKIESNDIAVENILGNWNATVIYIAKKKCLLFVNAETFFSVIIPRFSMKDIDKIDELFINCFYNQLLFEKINIDLKTISSIIDKIRFHATNNNKKVIGILNYNVEKINYFKYDYTVFNSSIIKEMTHKLNITPFKQLGWKLPCETMVAKLNNESEIVN
jgi:hypothetical protein